MALDLNPEALGSGLCSPGVAAAPDSPVRMEVPARVSFLPSVCMCLRQRETDGERQTRDVAQPGAGSWLSACECVRVSRCVHVCRNACMPWDSERHSSVHLFTVRCVEEPV